MRIAVVGGGILGLTLAYRLGDCGHQVVLYEAAPELGGLAACCDYGAFTWDRYYHCVLPQDENLLRLFDDLGLGDRLRWRATGTGYFVGGRHYSVSNNREFLRFPLLGLIDKARLAALFVYAGRFANPHRLHGVTAQAWLTRFCGRRGYAAFWRPLLRAKFGVFADRVSAVFIWATIKRLVGARRGAANREKLGYVSGGYGVVLDRLDGAIRAAGGSVRTGEQVEGVNPSAGGVRARVVTAADEEDYDQVFFTAPTRLARRVVAAEFQPVVAATDAVRATGRSYLGVICTVLVAKRPLTPYYVLNIGDESSPLTGVIEMTNLIDREQETNGHSLLYLPRYVDCADPRFDATDEAVVEELVDDGLAGLFPDFSRAEVISAHVHRARFVQPLPLADDPPAVPTAGVPRLERPFQILNTSMLDCATLNNNEVVGLVDRFLAGALQGLADTAS